MATLKADYLAMPLKSQIDASIKFWTPDWGIQGLDRLIHAFPYPTDAVGVKLDIIYREYGSRLKSDHQIAECFKRALETTHVNGPDYVETLVPKLQEATRQRNFVAISKYVHFFVDLSFPILDSYAEWVLRKHLGKPQPAKHLGKPQPENKPGRYRTFCEDLATLIRLAGLTNTPAQLDHYLWIAGEFWCWRDGDQTISNYLKPRFENLLENPASEPLLAALLDWDR